MSKRVTTKTEMRDRELVVAALELAKMSYKEQPGNFIRITSGNCKEARIDLNTGLVSGDTDYAHTHEDLGLLRQYYAEAKFRKEAPKHGVIITGRTVNKEGEVVLQCSRGG